MSESHGQPVHEARDVNTRAVALAGIGPFAVVVLLAAGVALLMVLLRDDAARDGADQATPSPALVAAAEHLGLGPEAPRDRTAPPAPPDLHSYGWIDRDRGIAHIPIEAAMEILAERGWPDRDQGRAP